jgi:hypothetical protein
MENWAHELNREFSKEDKQRANKYMKKYSTDLAIKKYKPKVHKDFISAQFEWPSSRAKTTKMMDEDTVK